MIGLFLSCIQLFTSQGINRCTGVMWITCDVLISCLDSHSDGTHSLKRIHWSASDVMLNFSKSVLMKKLIHILDSQLESEWLILIFGWTIPSSRFSSKYL